MTPKSIFFITLGAVVSCGLMAGIFFTFSAFAMRALGQLPPAQGMAAMQSINSEIQNPLFFAVFFGAAAASLWALFHGFSHRHETDGLFWLVGGAFYLIGAFLVTIVFNVPLNDALAAAKPGSAEGARVWANYLSVWTAWNHVRSLASLGATACFAIALRS